MLVLSRPSSIVYFFTCTCVCVCVSSYPCKRQPEGYNVHNIYDVSHVYIPLLLISLFLQYFPLPPSFLYIYLARNDSHVSAPRSRLHIFMRSCRCIYQFVYSCWQPQLFNSQLVIQTNCIVPVCGTCWPSDAWVYREVGVTAYITNDLFHNWWPLALRHWHLANGVYMQLQLKSI